MAVKTKHQSIVRFSNDVDNLEGVKTCATSRRFATAAEEDGLISAAIMSRRYCDQKRVLRWASNVGHEGVCGTEPLKPSVAAGRRSCRVWARRIRGHTCSCEPYSGRSLPGLG